MTSGSLLALLAIAHWRARALARALHATGDALQRERRLRTSSSALAAAARSSSKAVLAALDASLRDFDDRFDAVLVFTPAADELTCAYANGPRCEHYRGLRVRRDDESAIPARAAAQRCRVVSSGAATLLPSDRFSIAIPMLDGDVRAVVYASSSAGGPPASADAIVALVQSAAVPYAIAVERERDRIDATHDGLTGLLAPRVFRRRLHEELARVEAGTSESIVSLWFVDTDRFKSVNDRFGHPAGDAVLQTMARLLRAHLVPGTDLAARNGGDEFCALIRNASKSVAVDRAQRFLDAVRAHTFAVPMHVTASIGVATYPHDAGSSNELLELADGAMYHSKRNGRNRVSFVESPGRYASLAPEAHAHPSRSHERWPSPCPESSAERSS